MFRPRKTRTVVRSAKTGRFVKHWRAEKFPDTTVKHRYPIKKRK